MSHIQTESGRQTRTYVKLVANSQQCGNIEQGPLIYESPALPATGAFARTRSASSTSRNKQRGYLASGSARSFAGNLRQSAQGDSPRSDRARHLSRKRIADAGSCFRVLV